MENRMFMISYKAIFQKAWPKGAETHRINDSSSRKEACFWKGLWRRLKNIRLVICALISASIACLGVTAQEHASTVKAPFGLWTWRAEETQNIFSFRIEIVDGEWSAWIQSVPVQAKFDQGMISVTGPEGQKFLGELSADNSSIRGHWYQPSLSLHYQSIVTPIVLPAVRDGRWAADIAVQPRPFSIFLDIFENEESVATAVIRNPEGNEIQGATRFRVETETTQNWTLVAGSGDRQKQLQLKQMSNNELLLDHDLFEKPLSMKRTATNSAVGYYSRVENAGPARYISPPKLDDGWEVATPEQAGFDRAAFDTLVAELATSDPRNSRPRMIHSVLVAHKGRLVFEEYFHGYNRNTPHDTRSLAKVFAPILIGALQQQGYTISAEDRPIADILNKAGEPIDDPRKARISLTNLMTFTSGLDCSGNPESAGSEGRMWEQQEENDYWLYTARLRALHEPGQRYAYCSGSINLVGARLRSVAGMPIIDTFDRLIAQPLQFGPYHWALAPNGVAYLGGGVYMRPRDILKIGAMFVANGVWNNKQIIGEGWIKESTSPKIAISPSTTGLSQNDFANNYFGGLQAYVWRVDTVTVGEQSYDSYEATGNGGQVLVVVPALDLAAVFTGGNYRMGAIWGRWRNEIIGGHIIPALTD